MPWAGAGAQAPLTPHAPRGEAEAPADLSRSGQTPWKGVVGEGLAGLSSLPESSLPSMAACSNSSQAPPEGVWGRFPGELGWGTPLEDCCGDWQGSWTCSPRPVAACLVGLYGGQPSEGTMTDLSKVFQPSAAQRVGDSLWLARVGSWSSRW